MRVDLLVVGASFAGLATARAAARAGLRVALLEKKRAAGSKLHTTGIIVKDAIDHVSWLAEVPPALVRIIDGVRLYAPNLRHVDLFAPGYYYWATDTPRLLDWMTESVKADGVDVRLGSLFESATAASDGWRVPIAHGESLQARYLIGADGPHSRVAKALGLSRNREFLFGVEHEYASVGHDPRLLHCFVDRRIAPGYIGWSMAGVGVAQVGVAKRVRGKGQPVDLDALLAKVGDIVQPQGRPLAIRAGLIPCGGLLTNVACARALLVGDASGMVSPLTAGGIRTALQFGDEAGAAVAAFLAGRVADPAEWLPARYPTFATKRLLRRVLDRCQSDRVFNAMFSTRLLRQAAEQLYFNRKGEGSPRVVSRA